MLIVINYFICSDFVNYSINLNINYCIASTTILLNPELLRTHIIIKQISKNLAMYR